MNHFYKISEAIKYIDLHLNEALTVQAIAEQFAFSPYYFHRLFTAIVGKSLIAYVRDRRIAYACKMLNETDQKVLEIALDFGFDSAQGFSRTFKSITGMTPTEYRSRKIAPCIVPATELVRRFTNRLKGGILMNPDMIKKEKIVLAGVSGFGNETAEIWKRFIKLYKEAPPTGKRSEDSYEVRIYDSLTEHYKPKFHHVYTIPFFHIMLNFFYFTSSIYTIKSRLRQGVRGDGRGSKPV